MTQRAGVLSTKGAALAALCGFVMLSGAVYAAPSLSASRKSEVEITTAPSSLRAAGHLRGAIDIKIDAGNRGARNSKQTPPASAASTPSRLTVNVDATPAPEGASYLTSLTRIRRIPREQLSEEISKLRGSAARLSSTSPERRDLLDLANVMEVRRRTGLDVNELVEDITKKVVELRGLPLKEPVHFRLLDRESLHKVLEAEMDRQFPGTMLQDMEQSMKVLGALPERYDLRKAIVGLLSEQVAGLYDPKTKRLYVMQEFDLSRAIAKIILAHEICHALQDQHYNILPLLDGTPEESERTSAAQAVVEGDATILMQEYAAESLSLADLPQLLDAFGVDQRSYNRAPYILKQQLIFPYMGGAEFLQKLMLRGGDRMREEAFRHPPVSTEQILHPEKYSQKAPDLPTSFSLPNLETQFGSGWKKAYVSSLGEFQIKTLFEQWREWDAAKRAADGWGNDQLQFYTNGKSYGLVWGTEWDTTSDAEDFYQLFSELMRSKVYKAAYGVTAFPDTDPNVRRLPLNPQAEGDQAPVWFEFRRTGKRVLVLAADSSANMQLLEKQIERVLSAIPE